MLWIALIQFIAGFMLTLWARGKCTELDVQTGRRDARALIDDYGSNRGWYWPWSAINWLGFLLALLAPATLIALA